MPRQTTSQPGSLTSVRNRSSRRPMGQRAGRRRARPASSLQAHEQRKTPGVETLSAIASRAHQRSLRASVALVLVALLSVSCLRVVAAEAHFERVLSITNTATREPWFDASGRDGDLAADYECVGWRGTDGGTPDGPLRSGGEKGCYFQVREGMSGFCLYRHKATNALRRVVPVYNNTLYRGAWFPCSRAPLLVAYAAQSVQYVHDSEFSFEKNQASAREEISRRNPKAPAVSLERGVTMVVHGGVLASAYVSVRTLRETGSTLPVEIWFKRDEVDPAHALLADLETNYGVFVREIKDPRATKYFTKLYAVFYSAFDNVLLLDADNFAVADPSYLFEMPEFVEHGAIFWPDYWQPRQTTFNVQPTSLVWSVLGVDFVDMFEQESGQVLINRRQHMKALNVLMFYGFSGRVVIKRLQLVWGDKDLFRFAWLKTNSSLHFIMRHPGSAGRYNPETNRFCGVTIVQHDPCGDVVFLHRNGPKLRAGPGNQLEWTHIQQFLLDAPDDKYDIAEDQVFPNGRSCWGNSNPDENYYAMTHIAQFAFRDIEKRMLALAVEAEVVEERDKQRRRDRAAPPAIPTRLT